ncbi:MAG: lipid-A-disaccharide synthase [Rhodospirillaceae bacterium]|nr:lipid-A-disaccharide synthase [Rhodospirillaceae bacterium]
MKTEPPLLFLIAGEPSGDVLGSRLMAALKLETKNKIRFVGVGGPLMEAEGLKSLFPMRDLAVMGIAEILPHLPKFLRRIKETVNAIHLSQPDAIITIDSPTFANRVVRRLKDCSAIRIHYVAPSVWAWRPWRVNKYKKNFDHILALFPFEPPYFEAVGLPCHHVGHPVIEYGADRGNGAKFRKQHGIAPEEILICVLPGSRNGEVSRMGPVFTATLQKLHDRGHRFKVIVPTVDTVRELLPDIIENWPGNPIIIDNQEEKYDAMAAANTALAASGTISLELAIARVPYVIAYKVAWITGYIVQCLLHVKYANLINIILNASVVPERIQQFCDPNVLCDDLANILKDGGRAQLDNVAPALEQLGLGDRKPSVRAAQKVLDILKNGPEKPEPQKRD